MTPSLFNAVRGDKNLSDFFSSFESPQTSEIVSKLNDSPEIAKQFTWLISHSQYAQRTFLKYPQFAHSLILNQSFNCAFSLTDFSHKLDLTLKAVTEESFDAELRKFRHEMMLRIIWRDFNRLVSMQETTKEVSFLAQACINRVLRHHYEKLVKLFGYPRNHANVKQGFMVIAMGKLGGQELNLSSDIDLIFAYPEKGFTDKKHKTIENQIFFSKLSKRIIKSLHNQSTEGLVFRVDMRLRPYGQSGPIASSFADLEDYYLNQGRDWERLAMIRASVVAHNCTSDTLQTLERLKTNFVYRRYIDYSIIASLRTIKRLIVQEVQRRKLEDDIKLGPGGIREIEFIVQSLQLVRGGKDKELQDNQLLSVLPKLCQLRYLPKGVTEKLAQAYIFLRNTEHALQGFNDEQTHKLPKENNLQKNLANLMGFEDWENFYHTLGAHREQVKLQFSMVIGEEHKEKTGDNNRKQNWERLWQAPLDKQRCFCEFEKNHHENPSLSYKLLSDLFELANKKQIDILGKQRLNHFIPLLLAAVSETQKPTETLNRLIELIKAISRRSAYLTLLIENPVALTQLVKLSEVSHWFASQLAQTPALLAQLIDTNSLYSPPNRQQLEDELRRITLRFPQFDMEDQMESLRYFRLSHGMRVAAGELAGAMPLIKVSNYLTSIAESVLKHVLQLCWDEMIAQHGYPDGNERETPPFVILGYGKLGGIELSHGSDLDLVFVYQASTGGVSHGKKPLDNQTFFMRLGQKIIHLLTARTHYGQLYQVDMRLRPSGNSGLLVASVEGFTKYQQQNAWTWEHQALVRTRVVAGDEIIAQQFNQIRHDILCQKRDITQLKKDVIVMRNRMRSHLGQDRKNQQNKLFHLKQDPGGIVDIEFMVQYMVLAWSHSDPTLVTYTDNIRILENLAHSNILTAQEAGQLTEAYIIYRSYGHRLTLQQQALPVESKKLVDQRSKVVELWDSIFQTEEKSPKILRNRLE